MNLDSLNHFSATARLAENGAMLLCVWFLNKKDYYSAHTVVITHNATAILHSNTAVFFLCYSLTYNLPFIYVDAIFQCNFAPLFNLDPGGT